MGIVPFPNFVGVEINSGKVQSATVTDENGTRPVLSDIGRFFYYVDVIEPDGGRISMWDGTNKAEAVRQANLLALDFGGKICDRTGREQ
ncbi:hypothetical protein ASD64_11380 [Mesorhizobium sp. Root157]|uniref:hypothetical protein n=1 Tax=Mesorhizobium sp. Root157 TaxID=1736477 RepID=UPI00070015F5|nr:hypothetical protein [Mesorhizobium sp. Root157]KQZ80886.1 hypothetical protein ASD64_11380 [Mesorhizobium sp. Root157]